MIHAIIMAGGKGTRFWPLSRSIKAKQFLPILDNKPLINLTLERLDNFIPLENRWIVGNAPQKEFLDKIPKHLINSENIFLEPQGKNTAPCIAWAARHIYQQDPEAILVILPSDHWISSTKQLQHTLNRAIEEAKKNKLVTIGIPPTSPHTGYGYIQTKGQPINNVYAVVSFTEKPDEDIAASYIQSNAYFWNAGMFIWKAEVILEKFKKHLPQNETILDQIAQKQIQDAEAIRPLYKQLTAISIDYAIMEHTADQMALIPAEFKWNDIGNWRALEDFWEKDDAGNAVTGDSQLINAHNNIIYADNKLVTAIDINNLIIIDSKDALLILPKTSDQKIADLYKNLPDAIK